MKVSPYETEHPSQTDQEANPSGIAPRYYDYESEQSFLIQEVQNLRYRNGWLTGAVITLFLCFGGLGIWLFLSNLESPKQATLEDSTQVQGPVETRIQQLEQDIEALQQQIPGDLIESLSINQAGIQRLESQLQQLITKLERLQLNLPNIEIPSNSSELDELLEDGPLEPEADNPSTQTTPDRAPTPETRN